MELLAVNHAGGGATGWRDPEGNLLTTNRYTIDHSGVVTMDHAQGYDLLFRFHKLPSPAGQLVMPHLRTVPESGSSTGDGVRENGRLLTNVWPYRVVFSAQARFAKLRLAVVLDRWHTLSIADGTGEETADRRGIEFGYAGVTAKALSASEFQGRALATVLENSDTGAFDDLEFTVVAIDKHGEEHSGKGQGSALGSSPTITWTYSFPIPLSEVREFRALGRKLYWVEFPNVSLPRPNSPQSDPWPAGFEREEEVRFSSLLDFDTSKTGELPTIPGGNAGNPLAGIAAAVEYMQAHGFDVMHSQDHLDALGLKTVPLQPRDWSEISAKDLQQKLAEAGALTLELRPAGFPSTYGFQTREGSIGMFRLVKTDAEGTTLRIKRVPR